MKFADEAESVSQTVYFDKTARGFIHFSCIISVGLVRIRNSKIQMKLAVGVLVIDNIYTFGGL
jgi:hypothetical protein